MKLSSINYLLLSCLLLLFNNCDEENIVVEDIQDFNVYLEEEMDIQNMPALSVLLFKEDSILYENYLGQAQIEQNVALANDHLFLLASVSKMITATALLQLQEQGLFELNDNINDYLSFPVQIPDYSKAITFHMLLTHTAGIADGDALDSQYYYGEDSPVSLGYFLENYLVPNGEFYDEFDNFYDFEPGSEQEYSNIGNALIGVLVEQISGMDFNDYCKQHIFQPLDMTNTFWRLSEINQTIAQPYNYTGGDYEAIEHYTFTDYPNGGLRSTAQDLFKFLQVFVQDNPTQLLKKETMEAMTTLQIPTISNETGLHLFRFNEEHNLWGHDGGEQGVSTMVAFSPTTKVGVIILTNQGEADLDDILLQGYELGVKL